MHDVPGALHLVDRIQENPKTITVVLDGSLDARPGQFCMLWIPGVDEKPFSIAGPDPLMFTVSQVGPFSDAVYALEKGDPLWVRGPFGTGWSLGPARALLAGGGYGAAPLYFLARKLRESGAIVEAALGARTSSDLLFVDRFGGLGLPVHLATEDGSAGKLGRVTEVVALLLDSGRFDRLYACGPEAMLRALETQCRQARVTAELSHEAYMRCGVGICGSCEHESRLVCRDGPVFVVSDDGQT
ncbi:MAG: dihydroorotate dehydrogenase electron transfer subunit [Spirochaetia bacterium]